MNTRGKVITVTMALLIGAASLTGCSGVSDTPATGCVAADAKQIEGINSVLVAFTPGEEITDTAILTVDFPGVDAMRWNLLVAGKLTSGEKVLFAENTQERFLIPLNDAAIDAMPDAEAKGSAVGDARDSAEARSVLACVN